MGNSVVESLVAGRERRSTAGNRLASLLHQEADAEDTLFLEDEDDVEFEARDVEELSDVLLESSDDEDDYNGGGGVDGKEGGQGEEDLEGERELQQQAKEERAAKKRKAAEAFLKPRVSTRKRVTIQDGSSTTTTATAAQTTATSPSRGSPPRPRKKSERVSWIPEFTATRASSRTLSLQNRTETMKRLQESEKRRLHTIKLMEAAAAKKDKENPRKEMTQVERLKEAKLTEERNLKSLNKWEESEAVRLEEQRKKLAALQNRKLVGPVITWWSGTAEWNGEGKLVRVGKGLVEILDNSEDGEKGGGKKAKGRKSKGAKAAAVRSKDKEKSITDGNGDDSKEAVQLPQLHQTIDGRRENASNSNIESPQLPPSGPTQSDEAANAKSNAILTSDNIINASSNTPSNANPQPSSSTQEVLHRDHGPIPILLEGILDYAALPEPSPGREKDPPDMQRGEISPCTSPHVTSKPAKPKTEHSSRNLVVLENFDPAAVQTREGLVRVLFPSDPKRTWQRFKKYSGEKSNGVVYWEHTSVHPMSPRKECRTDF
ncbi:YL1 nuclear protein-domain-containing protein [Tuber indicum]|nr:YL1 nuclear protein-domain-containing protein [Tuber indicum]